MVSKGGVIEGGKCALGGFRRVCISCGLWGGSSRDMDRYWVEGKG